MQTVQQLWQPNYETAEIFKDNIQKYKTIVLPQYKCVLVKLYLKYLDKRYDIAVWFYCGHMFAQQIWKKYNDFKIEVWKIKFTKFLTTVVVLKYNCNFNKTKLEKQAFGKSESVIFAIFPFFLRFLIFQFIFFYF